MSTAVAFQFGGKTALVTGAGRGIGRATAKALAAAGAVVYGLSKNQQNLDSLSAECPSIRPVCVDLSDWNRTKKAVEDIGPVDLLVNNAALYDYKPFLDIESSEVDRIFNVNVKGLIAVSQVVAKHLIERRCPGAITNVAGALSVRGFPGVSVYGSSKSAVDQLTRIMAVELGPHKIRVNAVQPGFVHTTDMGRQVIDYMPAVKEVCLSRTPLGKLTGTEDVTNTILYLLSDSASMLNGVILPVDGGFLTT